jgi:hypothetical protein
VPGSKAQESRDVLPTVVQRAEATYSPIARTAHEQRDAVRDAEAETGPPLLRKSAEDTARTWKFVSHTPGTFHVTCRYKLLAADAVVAFLESSPVVEVVAPVGEMSIDWAWAGLGKWKAQLRSAHGNSRQVFGLHFSGPNSEWLDGGAVGQKVKVKKSILVTLVSQKGLKEVLLGFTIKLSQPDGAHVKTFLIGKMTRDKIVGTFVDDAGFRGEWTAVRIRPE